jgi:hypothetical protein
MPAHFWDSKKSLTPHTGVYKINADILQHQRKINKGTGSKILLFQFPVSSNSGPLMLSDGN